MWTDTFLTFLSISCCRGLSDGCPFSNQNAINDNLSWLALSVLLDRNLISLTHYLHPTIPPTISLLTQGFLDPSYSRLVHCPFTPKTHSANTQNYTWSYRSIYTEPWLLLFPCEFLISKSGASILGLKTFQKLHANTSLVTSQCGLPEILK